MRMPQIYLDCRSTSCRKNWSFQLHKYHLAPSSDAVESMLNNLRKTRPTPTDATRLRAAQLRIGHATGRS